MFFLNVCTLPVGFIATIHHRIPTTRLWVPGVEETGLAKQFRQLEYCQDVVYFRCAFSGPVMQISEPVGDA